jgi:hypothetical protein
MPWPGLAYCQSLQNKSTRYRLCFIEHVMTAGCSMPYSKTCQFWYSSRSRIYTNIWARPASFSVKRAEKYHKVIRDFERFPNYSTAEVRRRNSPFFLMCIHIHLSRSMIWRKMTILQMAIHPIVANLESKFLYLFLFCFLFLHSFLIVFSSGFIFERQYWYLVSTDCVKRDKLWSGPQRGAVLPEKLLLVRRASLGNR